MRYLAIICVCLLCAVSLESQIAPGALHRLIGNPSAGGSADSPTNWASLVGWYPPTTFYKLDQTTPATTGDAVGRWADVTSGHYDLTMDNSVRSVYATNRANGANGSNYFQVTLNGAGNAPRAYTNTMALGYTNYSIAALMQFYPTATFNNERMEFATSASGVLNYVPDNTLKIVATSGAATIPTNTWIDVIVVGNTANAVLYTNGVAYVTNSAALSLLNVMSLGVKSGNNASGNYQEILVYNESLSSAQLAAVHNYLTNKYGYTP